MSNQFSYHLPNSWFLTYFYTIRKYSKYSLNLTFCWECNDTSSLSSCIDDLLIFSSFANENWRLLTFSSHFFMSTGHDESDKLDMWCQKNNFQKLITDRKKVVPTFGNFFNLNERGKILKNIIIHMNQTIYIYEKLYLKIWKINKVRALFK